MIWNVRSAARRSLPCSPMSASITPTSVMSGKLWPLATSCVPMTISASPRAIDSSLRLNSLGAPEKSDDSNSIRAPANISEASSAKRSTPGPMGTSLSRAPHSSHESGNGRLAPHWWHTNLLVKRCSTIRASHWLQWICWPHARHSVIGANPRRLRNKSDCSRSSIRFRTSNASGPEIHFPLGRLSAFMSTVTISGRTAGPNLEGRSTRSYLPDRALVQVSSDGVADERITVALDEDARSTAMSRALYWIPSSCL